MSDEEERIVVTKHRIYRIPADVEGVPIEEHFPDTNFPPSLKGAKVYETKDGPVIAVPDPEHERS